MTSTERGRLTGAVRLAGMARQTEVGFLVAVILIGATTVLLVIGGHLVPFYHVTLAVFLGVAGIASVLTAVWLRHTQRELRGANEKLHQRMQTQAASLQEASAELGDEAKQRQEAEGALRESEENFRLLVDQMNDGFAIQDEAGVITYANDKLHEMLGYAPGELSGRSAVELIHERSLVEYRQRNAERREGESGSYELALATKHGGSLTAIISGQPLFDADGNIRGSFGVVTDISERKRAEDALRESEQKYRTLVERLNDGVAIQDEAGLITYASERLCKMLEYEAEALLGQPVSQFIHENSLETFQRRNRRLREGERTSDELELKTKSGKSILVLASAQPRFDEDGSFLGASAVLTDITERKQAEDALRESEQRFRLLVERMNDGLGTLDENGVIVYANPRLCEMLDYEPGALTGLHATEIIHEGSLSTFRKKMTERAEGQSGSYEMEMVTKGGESVSVILSAQPLFDANGEVRGSFAVVTDITELKQVESALRLQGEILQNVGEGVSLVRASDGVIVYTNPSYERLFGYGPGEMVGMHIALVNAPTDKSPEETSTEIVAALRRDGVWRGEVLNLKKDGTSFWTHANVSTFDHAEHGSVWVGYQTDITERKAAEEALRLQSEMLENMSEAVYLVRASDGVIVYTNPSWDRVFGYGPGAMVGKHVSLANAPTDKTPEETADEIIAALRSDGVWSGDILCIRQNGTTFWCHVNLSTFDYPGHGNVWVSYLVDITERKAAEDALRESEERYRSLVERMSEGVGLADESGVLTYASDRLCEMFEYEPGELAGVAISSLIHESSIEAFQQSYAERKEGQTSSYELEAVTKSGKSIFVLISAQPRFDENGTFQGSVAVLMDVTARKRAEEVLQNARDELEGKIENTMVQRNLYGLTFREFTVLHHLAAGKADKEIAAELVISPLTVHKHVANILAKMNASSRTEAGVRALRDGLLD